MNSLNRKKRMTAAAGLILALLLTAMSAFPAAAADVELKRTDETSSLTLEGAASGHTYTLYQILTGDVVVSSGSGSGNEVRRLADPEWGSGVNPDALASLPDRYQENGSPMTAEQIARLLANPNGTHDETAAAQEFAAALTGTDGLLRNGTAKKAETAGQMLTYGKLRPGWYLLTDDGGGRSGETVSYNILRVVGGQETIRPKTSVPTITKTVSAPVYSAVSKKEIRGASNVTSVSSFDGETGIARYAVTAVLPQDRADAGIAHGYSDYETYHFEIRDTAEEGITFDGESFAVTVRTGKKEITLLDGFELDVGDRSFVLTFEDTKNDDAAVSYRDASGSHVGGKLSELLGAGSRITVTYDAAVDIATLQARADGLDNQTKLVFSNDPNDGGTGTTTSEPVFATVYTFRFDWSKIAEGGKALRGAAFRLEKAVRSRDGSVRWVPVRQDGSREIEAGRNGLDGNAYRIEGLGEGSYRLTETTVPSGYEAVPSMTFDVRADYDRTTRKLRRLRVTDVTTGRRFGLGGSERFIAFRTDAANGAIRAVVTDPKKGMLPKTGDPTELGLLAAGIAGIVTAGFLVHRAAKKRASEE